MYLFAGRSEKSKYDARTAIHIAIEHNPGDAAISLCGSIPMAPASVAGPVVDITCRRCQQMIGDLPQMMVVNLTPALAG